MFNNDIREYAFKSRVKLYEIAQALNITDSYFSKILRKELSPEKKEELKQIIDKIRKGE